MHLIQPDWPAPVNVRAFATTRAGGVSKGPFASLNFSLAVGDDPEAVGRNRAALHAALDLERQPAWLRQVHGTRVYRAGQEVPPKSADAAWTNEPGRLCMVTTADCLPVLLCDAGGTEAAAAHAGWRGLAGGIVEATIDAFDAPPSRLLAWLGPAIGPDVYEVGEEVREAFTATQPADAHCFAPSPAGRWLADLYALASARLTRCGVPRIYGGGFCTYTQSDRFFSYRREKCSGRMATGVLLAPRPPAG